MQPEHFSVSRVSLGEVLLILFLEVRKYLAQMGSLVGYVFHNMRRKPDIPHACAFVKAQHFQRLLYLLKSVVHAGQDVAVPVDAAGESL